MDFSRITARRESKRLNRIHNESFVYGFNNKVEQELTSLTVGHGSHIVGSQNVTRQSGTAHLETTDGNHNRTVQVKDAHQSMTAGNKNVMAQSGTDNWGKTVGDRNYTIQFGKSNRHLANGVNETRTEVAGNKIETAPRKSKGILRFVSDLFSQFLESFKQREKL
jgi:hypothetical protein